MMCEGARNNRQRWQIWNEKTNNYVVKKLQAIYIIHEINQLFCLLTVQLLIT